MRAFSSSLEINRRRDRRVSSSARSSAVWAGWSAACTGEADFPCELLKQAAATAANARPMVSGARIRLLNLIVDFDGCSFSRWAQRADIILGFNRSYTRRVKNTN